MICESKMLISVWTYFLVGRKRINAIERLILVSTRPEIMCNIKNLCLKPNRAQPQSSLFIILRYSSSFLCQELCPNGDVGYMDALGEDILILVIQIGFWVDFRPRLFGSGRITLKCYTHRYKEQRPHIRLHNTLEVRSTCQKGNSQIFPIQVCMFN